MADPIDFELASAHKYFSATCFNRAWDLIDMPQRSAEEEEAMVLLAMASLWHWTQRADCSGQNRALGTWQVSRALALARQAEGARLFAQKSLELSQSEGPFYLGYAHEALARAAFVSGDPAQARKELEQARRLLDQVIDAEEREGLEKDLDGLQASLEAGAD
ncbi:MAG: hypothetical protein MUO23_11920 [Anaerolineales bacterium]|nr:hypothetical protein [Anaerolineales bacterium]